MTTTALALAVTALLVLAAAGGPPSPPPATPARVTGVAGSVPRSPGAVTPGPTSPEPSTAGGWQPPLVGGVLLRRFDRPASPWGAGHRGVDLAASPGTVVRAPAAGRVTVASVVVDRGVVTVEHPGGLRSSLEPVTADVDVGTHVVAGEPVGRVDPAGGHCAPAACLHWGVRRGTEYVDPLSLLATPGPVVLLPVPPH